MGKLLVADFNGTLFLDPTDEPLYKAIGEAVKKRTLHNLAHGKVRRLPRLLGLLRTRTKLKEAIQRSRTGALPLSTVYDIFNSGVIAGEPVKVITDAADRYVRESTDKMDRHMLGPLSAAHKEGWETALLSSSYIHVIRGLLGATGYRDLFPAYNMYANRLQANGPIAVGFTLNYLDNKVDPFRAEFIVKGRRKPDQLYYTGDSPVEEPIAQLLPPGHFIIPFYASQEYRETLTKKHRAFAPKNDEDLKRYLLKQDRSDR